MRCLPRVVSCVCDRSVYYYECVSEARVSSAGFPGRDVCFDSLGPRGLHAVSRTPSRPLLYPLFTLFTPTALDCGYVLRQTTDTILIRTSNSQRSAPSRHYSHRTTQLAPISYNTIQHYYYLRLRATYH